MRQNLPPMAVREACVTIKLLHHDFQSKTCQEEPTPGNEQKDAVYSKVPMDWPLIDNGNHRVASPKGK